jgi:hypothetical protein
VVSTKLVVQPSAEDVQPHGHILLLEKASRGFKEIALRCTREGWFQEAEREPGK